MSNDFLLYHRVFFFFFLFEIARRVLNQAYYYNDNNVSAALHERAFPSLIILLIHCNNCCHPSRCKVVTLQRRLFFFFRSSMTTRVRAATNVFLYFVVFTRGPRPRGIAQRFFFLLLIIIYIDSYTSLHGRVLFRFYSSAVVNINRIYFLVARWYALLNTFYGSDTRARAPLLLCAA